MSFKAYYNFYKANNTYLEVCFIKVVYIILINAIFGFCLINKSKLRANYFKVFLKYSLLILCLVKDYFQFRQMRYKSL